MSAPLKVVSAGFELVGGREDLNLRPLIPNQGVVGGLHDGCAQFGQMFPTFNIVDDYTRECLWRAALGVEKIDRAGLEFGRFVAGALDATDLWADLNDSRSLQPIPTAH